jgi:hypothetical protein
MAAVAIAVWTEKNWAYARVLSGYEDDIDTTLTPPRTQCGATSGKAEKSAHFECAVGYC